MFKTFKSILSILVYLLVSGLFVNCSSDDESLDLFVSSRQFEINSNGGNIDIPLSTNQTIEFTIPSNAQSWIQAKTVTTNNKVTGVTLSVASSEEYDKRTADILIKGGSLVETITINQTGTQILTLDKKEYNISDKGGVVYVETKSNFEYEVILPGADWLKMDKTKSVSTSKVSFTVEANETYDSRQAVIIFKDNNSNLEKSLTINQSQKNAIVLSKNDYLFENEGGIIDVEVSSNIDYTTKIEGNWITQVSTRSLTTKSLSFSVNKIPFEEKERTGKIIFENQELGISQVINIKQVNMFGLQEQYVTIHEGDIVKLTLVNNLEDKSVDWVSSNEDIVTVDSDGYITAIAKGQAIITVKSSDGLHESSSEIEVRRVVDDVKLDWSAGYSYTSWSGYNYYIESKVTNYLSEPILMNTLTSYDMNNEGAQILSGEINETVMPGSTLENYGISGRVKYEYVKFVWTFTYKDKLYTKEHTVTVNF